MKLSEDSADNLAKFFEALGICLAPEVVLGVQIPYGSPWSVSREYAEH
jgi:hypothetical protein